MAGKKKTIHILLAVIILILAEYFLSNNYHAQSAVEIDLESGEKTFETAKTSPDIIKYKDFDQPPENPEIESEKAKVIEETKKEVTAAEKKETPIEIPENPDQELIAAAKTAIDSAGYKATDLYRYQNINKDSLPELFFKVKKKDSGQQRTRRLAIFSAANNRAPFLFLLKTVHMEDIVYFELVDFNFDHLQDIVLSDRSFRTCNTFVLHQRKNGITEVFSSSQRGPCQKDSRPQFKQVIAGGPLEMIGYTPLQDSASCLRGYQQAKLFQWNGRRFIETYKNVPKFNAEQKKRYQQAINKIDKRVKELEKNLRGRPSLYIEYDCLLNAKKKYLQLLKK